MTQLTKEELSLLKKFQKCINDRSIQSMDKRLYHFFMYECTFIAHYSIHGFRDEYSGKDFLRWFLTFAEPNWMFFNQNGKFENLKRVCVEYAQQQKNCVIEDFQRRERNQKIRLLQALSAELGITGSVDNDGKENKASALPLLEDDSGQFLLFN